VRSLLQSQQRAPLLIDVRACAGIIALIVIVVIGAPLALFGLFRWAKRRSSKRGPIEGETMMQSLTASDHAYYPANAGAEGYTAGGESETQTGYTAL
jgi:hypothetical protein